MGNYRINRPKVVADIFQDEAVAVNFDTGRYYGLSGTALAVWQSLEGNSEAGGIAAELSRRYMAEESQLQADIDAFLDRLVREGLIVAEELVRSAGTGEAADGPARAAWVKPELQVYEDMQDLLLLDPIHDVDETGWPAKKPEAESGAGV